MIIGHHFRPDALRAERINARMHRELAISLRHVCDESRGVLAFDEAALARLLEGLESGLAYPATTFARYYDLVDAIVEDRLEEALALFDELGGSRPWAGGLDIQALGSQEIGPDGDRYQRLMNADPTLDLGFAAPPPELTAAFAPKLAEGLDLLRRGLPDLHGEFCGIVRQIVVCGGDPTKSLQFDGGSHFRLWGALFVNAEFHPTPLAVVEVLAHESAHSLLFGFCTQSPLVENDEAERFASPLRSDPRPMEGIYHATYVSARMHYAMNQMARSDLLDEEETAFAERAANTDLANFRAGHEVLARHGRLTPMGAELMGAAKAYMDACA